MSGTCVKKVEKIELKGDMRKACLDSVRKKLIQEKEDYLNNELISAFYKVMDKKWVELKDKNVFVVKLNSGERILVPNTIGWEYDYNQFPEKVLDQKSRWLTVVEAEEVFDLSELLLPCYRYDDGSISCVYCKSEKYNYSCSYITVSGGNEYWNGRIGYYRLSDECHSEYSSAVSNSSYFNMRVSDFDVSSGLVLTFAKKDWIPEGLDADKEKVLKQCFTLLKNEDIVATNYKLCISDKYRERLLEGKKDELFGDSLTEEAILKGVISVEEIAQLLLTCDTRRAGIEAYDRKLLEDPGRGHWELWANAGNTKNVATLDGICMARNPVADIHWDGVIGIDFGTKSTVVVCQDKTAKITPIRIGSGNYSQEVKKSDYENPTVMQFLNLEEFKKCYRAEKGRPMTSWSDITVSHTAAEALKADNASNKYYSYFSDLKQWCGDKTRHVRIRDLKEKEYELKPFVKLGKEDLDPIELYAYYLGLFINNMHRGIFLDYILSFPVTYEKQVKERLLASFKKGIMKSLPIEVINNEEAMAAFRVEQGASEPAAYAVCALKEYHMEPEKGQKIFYGIFDFGGGTTDFDFGLWRAPENEREERRYDYVIEHFGASGDPYLGGENLLELLAFEIFKKNKEVCRTENLSFMQPHDAEAFPGCETLIKKSQEAMLNTKQVMEKLRDFWEEKEDELDEKIMVSLFDNSGAHKANIELKVDEKELKKILQERISVGVENFFNALKRNFAREDLGMVNKVHIFLAGNSSRSSIVREAFNKKIKAAEAELTEYLKKKGNEDNGNVHYEVHQPLGFTSPVNSQITKKADSTNKAEQKTENNNSKSEQQNREEDLTKPTGKTGVAYGLLMCRKGSRIKDVPEKKHDEEIKFKYFLGEDRHGNVKVRISTDIKYNEWVEFIDASEDTFEFYYTSQPNVTTGKMRTDEVMRKKCTITKEYDEEDIYIYIRAVKPTVVEYAVATEEGIKKGNYLEKPVRIELS